MIDLVVGEEYEYSTNKGIKWWKCVVKYKFEKADENTEPDEYVIYCPHLRRDQVVSCKTLLRKPMTDTQKMMEDAGNFTVKVMSREESLHLFSKHLIDLGWTKG